MKYNLFTIIFFSYTIVMVDSIAPANKTSKQNKRQKRLSTNYKTK